MKPLRKIRKMKTKDVTDLKGMRGRRRTKTKRGLKKGKTRINIGKNTRREIAAREKTSLKNVTWMILMVKEGKGNVLGFWKVN